MPVLPTTTRALRRNYVFQVVGTATLKLAQQTKAGYLVKGRCNLNNLLMTVFTISLKPVIHMTDEQFYELCRANPDLKFDRSAAGANDTQYNEKLSTNFQKK